MSRFRTIAAGLVLALPAAAVIAQDNPWRVPSAPAGYVPGYAVEARPAPGYGGYRALPPAQGYERPETHRPRQIAPAYAAPRPSTWSEEPIESTRHESYPGQYGDPGFGRPQWHAPRPPMPVTTGSTHAFDADRRGYREAGLPPHPGAERAAPAPAYAPRAGQPWSGAISAGHGAGYLPSAMDPPDARHSSAPEYPYDPALERPAYSGQYGEYPPLEQPSRPRFRQAARDQAVDPRHDDDRRYQGYAPPPSPPSGAAPRPHGSNGYPAGAYAQPVYAQPAYGQATYGANLAGPSTLTVPQAGLPGLSSYGGYGSLPGVGGYGYGGPPDPYTYPYAPPAPGW